MDDVRRDIRRFYDYFFFSFVDKLICNDIFLKHPLKKYIKWLVLSKKKWKQKIYMLQKIMIVEGIELLESW